MLKTSILRANACLSNPYPGGGGGGGEGAEDGVADGVLFFFPWKGWVQYSS
jgi:hypothetical protein